MIGGLIGAVGSGQGSSLGNSGPAYGGDTVLGDFDMGGGNTINMGTAAGSGTSAGFAASAFGGAGIDPVVIAGVVGAVGLFLWMRSKK